MNSRAISLLFGLTFLCVRCGGPADNLVGPGSTSTVVASANVDAGTAAVSGPSPDVGWDPGNTFVLIVGLTQWAHHGGFANEPGDGYRLLESAIEAAGVPASNVTLLENATATKAAIEQDLAQVAGRAGPGSTFILYFGSEGSFQALQDGVRDALVSAYDSWEYPSPNWQSSWVSGSEVSEILQQSWTGNRLILVSDSCYSGGFASVVIPELAGREVAVLTSATPDNMASANWTFTNNLSLFFRGQSPLLDTDHTGVLTLGTLMTFLTRENRYVEEVPVTMEATATFDKGFVFGKVQQTAQQQVGDYVDALYAVDQQYYRAQIVGVSGIGEQAQARVRYTWYGNEATVSLRSQVRPAQWNTVPVGKAVTVATRMSGDLAGTVTEATSDGVWAMVRYSDKASEGSWLGLVSPNAATPVGPTSDAYLLP